MALDFSTGMLAAARASGTPVNADVVNLPLQDGVSDVTIAAHMLYHASDIPAAIAELRRITRRGGLLLVVLHGANHLRELRGLMDETTERVTLQRAEPMLREVFEDVTLHIYRDVLSVPVVQPVLDYAASFTRSRGLTQAQLALEVERQIDQTGAFRCITEPGILVCR